MNGLLHFDTIFVLFCLVMFVLFKIKSCGFYKLIYHKYGPYFLVTISMKKCFFSELYLSRYPILLTRLGGPVPDPILPEKL